MEQRRHGGGKNNVSQMELARDAWSHLDPEFQKPLAMWLDNKTERPKTVELPEARSGFRVRKIGSKQPRFISGRSLR